MYTNLHWIETSPGALAIASRPRGGDWLDDEIREWRDHGVDQVVSLLTPPEATDLDLEREEQVCREYGVHYRNLAIEDRSTPDSEPEAARIVDAIVHDLAEGERVVIHCRQGIGRAGMIAAAVLIRLGWQAEAAIDRVSQTRNMPVPETAAQREWIERFAHPVLTRTDR
jgi:protein-tyrosine phosphatase